MDLSIWDAKRPEPYKRCLPQVGDPTKSREIWPCCLLKNPFLVGGWTNPFEKYAQVKLDYLPSRVENKEDLKPQLV